MKVYNLKYVVTACVMLHNICIATNNPCNPRWKLTNKIINRSKSKSESNKNADII